MNTTKPSNAVREGADSAAAFNNLGASQRQLQHFDEARRWLSAAIEKDARLQPAYVNRAVVDFEQAHRTENRRPILGCSDVEQAIQIGPVAGEVYWIAALLYAVDSKFDKASAAKSIDYMSQALDHGLAKQALEGNRFLHSIRSEPSFQALLSKTPTGDRRAFNVSYFVRP